ncbi:pre-mRNA splicing factor ATP-dependent RNA helicase PRP43 [Colletotrichum tofieldiae]|uniref:Pre-mRNA splicing factor ATP-dependent RNA helicase PRP43 n=1 Tax=Colletotrichum tofieldiae TaxID=708197 RepID=A0A166PBS8_9PEZI|nr:pre-mRNA splicing factor ATP-dependent RNA helicase PRP43 [Colletotrichum tofieldiae]
MDSVLRNQATAAKIQLLEDATQNPMTGNAWPRGHDIILQGRRRLPVYGRYQDILDKYHQSQVMILSSETGSGKSTQVPQLLVYDEYASGLQIVCTQPRRLAATELASRVADEMGVILGEEVGYKIRGDQMVNKNKKKTRLTYLTEGVLLRQLSSDKNLSAYACVIIDEAHERTVNLDLLLALLKKVVQRRKDFKVVIMSATMDTKLFQDYFNNCPLVHISGRNFEVQVLYTAPANAGPSFVTLAAGVVVHIHEKEKPGHILVFLPGEDEIQQVCRLVRLNTKNLDVFPLYAALSASDQRLALNSSGTNRKCIVSTNIAETSLTIDNVVYVVDSGLSRQLIFNPRLRLNMLEIRPISQASARQRAGRTGRTRDGVCYRLYSKEDYDHMAATTEPAIRCTSIDTAVLKLGAAGYRKLIDFDWIDAPHPESIARAAQDLRDWGFLNDDAALTQSGRLAAKCPLDPIWYRAIQAGTKIGCAMNIVDIALLCSSQSPIFMRPAQYRQVADLAKTAFAHPLSDHLTLTNAFDAYMQARRIHQQVNGPKFDLGIWCTDHFLNMQALEQVRIARLELGHFLANVAKIPPTRTSIVDMTSVRKALAIAFHTHSAIHRTGDEYRTVHENTPALLSPLSSLVGGNYEWIVYTNFFTGGARQYLQIATAIKAEWLVEARLPKTGNGGLRQPDVKRSLDDAKARIEASKAN